jgi:hypothetical protein
MKHMHHIIPRHAGGTDDPSNLIELTPEEHAEAHRKLYEEHGRIQDKLAWLGLAKLATNKEIIAELLAQPKSEEHKQKISEAHKGMKKPWVCGGKGLKGKSKSEEHKQKISEAHKGMKKPWARGGVGNKGKPKSEAHIKAVQKALNSNEVKEKISASWASKPIVKCPHCGKQGKEGHNMNRYHFDKCKEK